MATVYSAVQSLEGKPKEGNGECVTLVKNHTSVGWTGNWRQGDNVVSAISLAQGTACNSDLCQRQICESVSW